MEEDNQKSEFDLAQKRIKRARRAKVRADDDQDLAGARDRLEKIISMAIDNRRKPSLDK